MKTKITFEFGESLGSMPLLLSIMDLADDSSSGSVTDVLVRTDIGVFPAREYLRNLIKANRHRLEIGGQITSGQLWRLYKLGARYLSITAGKMNALIRLSTNTWRISPHAAICPDMEVDDVNYCVFAGGTDALIAAVLAHDSNARQALTVSGFVNLAHEMANQPHTRILPQEEAMSAINWK